MLLINSGRPASWVVCVALVGCLAAIRTDRLIGLPLSSEHKASASTDSAAIEALLMCRETTVTADMPEQARSLVAEYDETAMRIRRQAAQAIREERLAVMRRLKSLQDNYTRAAALDEAVAIRDTIRRMLEAGYPSINNPGSMTAYSNQIGKSFLVRLTGRTNGSVYGTDAYTYDSDIATAAVHSGALEDGESGIVVVKLISTHTPHVGSTRHSVRSYDYGPYPASYTICRWRPTLEEIELGSLKLE